MSDLRRDIDEEDELRRLLSRTERGLVTPPFAALRARRAGGGMPHGLTAAAAVALVLLTVMIVPAALRPGTPTSGSPSPAPTAVAVAVPPGATPASVTPCQEIATPPYLPTQAGYVTRTGRTASSQDVVTLTVPELQVNGQPAELTVVAEAARPLWMITREGARQIGPQGQRAVTLVFTGGLSATPAPQGLTPSIRVRSEMRAEWYEPNGTCPYFTAKLLSSGSDARALETELIKIIESMPLTAALAGASPAPTWTVMRLLPEQEAWSRIRAMFPTGPVAQPTWLPPEVDRRGVDLRTLEVTPTRVYEVVYLDATGRPMITFRLGPVEPMRESAAGFCCVRGARATLHFASYLFNDPTRPGVRRMQWEEQTRTLSFTSEFIKGEDMLRIAWELDRATAPPNPYPNVRAKRGACASSTSAEDTVRRMLALYGSTDRDALLDCIALDRIISAGTGGTAGAGGADLPTTSGVTTQERSEIAGRILVMASWTFSSDPGGPSGRTPTQFFLLGLEDGAWRIYDVGTAPFGTPP